jgi:hypothetical protein
MKSLIKPLVVSLFLAALTLPSIVVAQTSSQALGSISTPDRLPSSLGTLEFKDGAPSKETVAKIYDNLDLMHAVEAFVNAYQGASTSAIFKGMNEAGIPNNEVLIFSKLMRNIRNIRDVLNNLKFDKILHAAMRSSTATREFTTDFRGTGKSIPKLSSSTA